MKTNLEAAKMLAEAIALDLFECGYGTDDQRVGMLERARQRGADMIEAHDKELLNAAHAEYLGAVMRCAL